MWTTAPSACASSPTLSTASSSVAEPSVPGHNWVCNHLALRCGGRPVQSPSVVDREQPARTADPTPRRVRAGKTAASGLLAEASIALIRLSDTAPPERTRNSAARRAGRRRRARDRSIAGVSSETPPAAASRESRRDRRRCRLCRIGPGALLRPGPPKNRLCRIRHNRLYVQNAVMLKRCSTGWVSPAQRVFGW